MVPAKNLLKWSVATAVALGVALALVAHKTGFAVPQNPAERSIEFTEKLEITVPRGAKQARIWVPVPVSDPYQTTDILKVEGPAAYRTVKDMDFGNPLLYFEPGPGEGARNVEIEVRYRIVRREQRGLGDGAISGYDRDAAVPLSEYLKPRGREAMPRKVRKLSRETTAGISGPVEKARAIYRYVLKHMRYDKSGEGWGRGDPLFACDLGRGNCTDFHSLFIAMARSCGIPARFQMGIPLPEGKDGEPSGAYHCWAEFYTEGHGWVPVDISEAWKDPQKADYFFGNLDTNRVLLSTGREIRLSPRQKGEALNFLSKPYIELDGKPFKEFKLVRRFKDI